MTIIKARLKDQVLTVTSAPVVASGGVEEDIVSFDFDDTWTGYTKKAVFYRDKSSVYHVAVGSNNTAVVPCEVLRQEGFMFLGVFGTKGSEIKTSTVARYRVELGAITACKLGGGGGGTEDVQWHQCPETVRNYLAGVTYDPGDYTVSRIAEFAPASAVHSNTKPIGKTVDGVTYYNEVPNQETPFSSANTAGTLKPLDKLRWLNTPSAVNVRDLGGWACDGGTVRYGLLFRGGEVSAADRDVLVGECGVRHDLNLRGTAEATWTESPLGSDIRFTKADDYNWYSATVNEAWKVNLRCVFDAVVHNEPVYFHCSAGADRTGTLACVLEGLLGVSQSDIDKDYELTCFYSGTGSDSAARRRNESEWTGLISQINALDGSTFRDKCVTFAAMLGFTAAEINAFRAAMIDGTPETVTPSIGTFAVTNTLTNASTDNSAVSAVQYQPYKANIIVPDGYAISDVKVTMGGTDITTEAFKGTKTNLNYAVTLNLANCSSSNNKNVAMAGQAYVAFIEAQTDYTLDSATVVITMGGVDVSNYYSDGKIVIPNVTGDLVITISAVASAQETVPITWLNGYTCTYTVDSPCTTSANASYIITDLMDVEYGKTYSFDMVSPNSGFGLRFIGIDENGIVTEAENIIPGREGETTLEWTPKLSTTRKMRLRSYSSAADNLTAVTELKVS